MRSSISDDRRWQPEFSKIGDGFNSVIVSV